MSTTTGPLENLSPASSFPVERVTVQLVSKMFPATPARHIEAHLPFVLTGLADMSLLDRDMILMALSTIRAEAESFLPCNEGKSKFNTSPGGDPFDLYDHRKDLGNVCAPDGFRFRGRGFVQLTGRANYKLFAKKVGHDLVGNPDLATDSHVASKILAAFLKDKETRIRQAIASDDLRTARRLVNGGSNGLDRFQDAFRIGSTLIHA